MQFFRIAFMRYLPYVVIRIIKVLGIDQSTLHGLIMEVVGVLLVLAFINAMAACSDNTPRFCWQTFPAVWASLACLPWESR